MPPAGSADSCRVLKEGLEFVEQFKVLLLNRANRVPGIYEHSTGGVLGTVTDPRLVFAAALKACASAVILCHNHPSGNLKPSQRTKKKQGESCWTSPSSTTSSSPVRDTIL